MYEENDGGKSFTVFYSPRGVCHFFNIILFEKSNVKFHCFNRAYFSIFIKEVAKTSLINDLINFIEQNEMQVRRR